MTGSGRHAKFHHMHPVRSVLGISDETAGNPLAPVRKQVVGAGDVVETADGRSWLVQSVVHVGERGSVCVFTDGVDEHLALLHRYTCRFFQPGEISGQIAADGGEWRGETLLVHVDGQRFSVENAGEQWFAEPGGEIGAVVLPAVDGDI